MNTPLLLKPNVQLEALIDQWYAWPQLIPPATAARNITERYLRIMDTYIRAPHIHAQALKDPNMVGGPFIDYGGKRADEIRAVRDQTIRTRGNLIELSAAFAALDNLLRTSAKGFSLAPLYEKVPSILRGYVELVYDLNNNPSYKIIEPLLYRSEYYDPSAQSLALSFTKGDERPFALSTPRLEEKDTVHLRLPFDSEAAGELFKLRYEPRRWGEIQEILNLDDKRSEAFYSFLTPEPLPQHAPYSGDGARWRYFGHACVLMETKKVSLLFDPLLSYAYPSDIPRYTYQDIPNSIDYVLLTHDHEDHVLFETLLQIRHRVKTIVVPRNTTGALQDPSLKLILQKLGFKNIIELSDMESIPIDGGEITGIPFFGEHCDLDMGSKIAYAARVAGHSFLFAADSCNLESHLYDHIRRDLGAFETLFIGMECDGAALTWLYRPLLTQLLEREMDESRRLNGSDYDQAMGIVNRFNFREVYVYAMAQEPWLGHIRGAKPTPHSRPSLEANRLTNECRSRGIVSERLFGKKEMILE